MGVFGCLSGSIYPEALGFNDAHWLDGPTGRGTPSVSLVTVINNQLHFYTHLLVLNTGSNPSAGLAAVFMVEIKLLYLNIRLIILRTTV